MFSRHQAHRGQVGRIDLDPDRGLLGAVDRDLPHPLDLGQLLGDDVVGVVVDIARGQGRGGQGQDDDRRVRWVEVPPGRRADQIGRQVSAGGVDRRLNVQHPAPSMLRLRLNWTETEELPRLLVEVSSLTPAISAKRRSSGADTEVAMPSPDPLQRPEHPLTLRVGNSIWGSRRRPRQEEEGHPTPASSSPSGQERRRNGAPNERAGEVHQSISPAGGSALPASGPCSSAVLLSPASASG